MSSIERAAELIGGQTALAKLFDLKQGHVWGWVHKRKQAPAKYIRQISAATNGAVSVIDLLKDHEDSSETES